MKMYTQWNNRWNSSWRAILLLIVCVSLAACSDSATNSSSGGEPDTSISKGEDVGTEQDIGTEQDVEDDTDLPKEGYRVRGQLVPSSGFSMGKSYTISGTLRAGSEPTDLKGATYRLTATP